MMRIDRSEWDVIIVGAGAAGVAAAETLCGMEHRPAVLVLSEEDRLPYKRTKISKNIARGFEREQFAQHPEQWYSEQGFGLALRARVAALELSAHRLELADGRQLTWSRLILAPGADPLLPVLPAEPGEDRRVFLIRTAAQVEGLRAAAGSARCVAVVGTGVLGVEVAEQVRLLGKEVMLVGRDARLMPRQLNIPAAARLRQVLAVNGVKIRLAEAAIPIERRRGGGYAVGLSDGETEADLLVFCLGVRPRTDLAAAAGVAVDHGILVDPTLRTSHPDVFAAGDAAQHPDGTVTHLWHAAQHQGELAARSAAGAAVYHDNPPFRLKCEVFGQYFFSMDVPAIGMSRPQRATQPAVAAAFLPSGSSRAATAAPAKLEQVEETRGQIYRCLYFCDGRLSGALMINDRERAKQYEQAVREGWSARRIDAELSLE